MDFKLLAEQYKNELFNHVIPFWLEKSQDLEYGGYLTCLERDGKVFDSSYPRKKPIEFRLGQGQVIEGWDEGIALLQVGDKARFVIPSDLAYGPSGAGGVIPIPPHATLIFDVELMDVK